MCLIAFAHNYHPDFPFILVANRDEFYSRPTSKLGFWPDYPDILGGRDLKASGTWMAMNKAGRFAAVTNYRDLSNIDPVAKTRGELPIDFLNTSEETMAYMAHLNQRANQYNGFNFLARSGDEMMHFSNYENKINQLEHGIYAVSNALLDTPWPKVTTLKNRFAEQIRNGVDADALMKLLMDENTAPDNELPGTGVPLELERALSAICIRTPEYGTCSSTLIIQDKYGLVTYKERTHQVPGRNNETIAINFSL